MSALKTNNDQNKDIVYCNKETKKCTESEEVLAAYIAENDDPGNDYTFNIPHISLNAEITPNSSFIDKNVNFFEDINELQITNDLDEGRITGAPIISLKAINTPESSFIENGVEYSSNISEHGQTTNDSEEEYIDGELADLITLRSKYPLNPILAYLNVNSLRGSKMDQVREMCRLAPIDILCLDESKLSYDFPDAQFQIEGYQYPPFRRDRISKKSQTNDCLGGGKLIFLKSGLINTRLKNIETPTAESICIELTISNRKWFVMYAYRPESINRLIFFEEIKKTLNQAVNKYDNIILAGDLNVDMDIPSKDVHGYLSDICDTFDLTNLIKGKTCTQSEQGSSLDVILTNRPRSFQKSCLIETGISDHHKLIMTFFRCHFQKFPAKNISYRSYKHFDEELFLADLKALQFNDLKENPSEAYDLLTNKFARLVEKHAPLKSKKIRGNQAPFMNKIYSKAIMNKSKMRNKYNKWKSRENYLNYQKSKSHCKKIGYSAKREHLKKATENGIMTSKIFWDTVKPILTNKGGTSGDVIILEENGKLISNEKEIVEIFNDHYINIVETTTGHTPLSIGNPLDPQCDAATVKEIIVKFASHPCIMKIKDHFEAQNFSFSIPLATKDEVNKIIKSIDISKATGPDKIPPKLVQISADIIDEHMTDIINFDISNNSFSEGAKMAHIRTIFKKLERIDKVNYRPVSILNTFSKISERYIQDKLTPLIDKCLSVFISAYRKKYSTNHVLIRLIENWKKHLDNKKFVGAVLMDLSKAFDCIPHDLLIAKMNAYGFDFDTLVFLYSYLKRRKQSVKINNIFSSFQVLLSGVPQGSILGPILFNLFINDMFLWIENANLENFADDNTISAFANSIPELISVLETESEIAIDWFNKNEMIANASKFHAIIVNRCGRHTDTHVLNIAGEMIESEESVPLLGVEIDNKLNFGKHISSLCKKAAGQLNAICRIRNAIGGEETKILIQSFIFSNFNYCPIVWMLCSAESMRKIERIQERAYRLLHNDYTSSYDDLIHNLNDITMEVKRLRILATEVFKTLNNLNPPYMNEIFQKNGAKSNYPLDLKMQSHRFVTYGENSVRVLAPKVWNALPEYFKVHRSFESFKRLIKTWTADFKCGCSMCRHLDNSE